jgi:hypothetical protein
VPPSQRNRPTQRLLQQQHGHSNCACLPAHLPQSRARFHLRSACCAPLEDRRDFFRFSAC